ncbi:hypothetical protein Sjap_020259 [Stephania japonica]|uniref:QWRF motif-containing protein 7 n=1 Tax=Stephania japonica TaxID=461633 RepID=A0AAP0I0A7_9MAGN
MPARAIDEETAITPGRYSVSHHGDFSARKLVPAGKRNKAKSVTNSPSAWALSPGRSSPLAAMGSSYTTKKVEMRITTGSIINGAKVKSGGASVSDVFKFFRIKKVPRIQEEEFQRYRIWHTRLVQWRYVNARAEVAMLAQSSVAETPLMVGRNEAYASIALVIVSCNKALCLRCYWVIELSCYTINKKMCNVMLWILHLQNSVIDKRIQIQKIKQEIKLRHIVYGEIHLLDEWAKIEKRNTEAVGKLYRTLLPLATKLPLAHCAKGDTFSVYQALSILKDAMESIEATIDLFYDQVARTASLLKELVETLAQEKLGLEELAKTRAWIAALQMAASMTSKTCCRLVKQRPKRIVKPNWTRDYKM